MSSPLPPQPPGVVERFHIDKVIGVFMALIGFSLAALISLGTGTAPPGSNTASVTTLFLGALLVLVLGVVIVNKRPLLRRELRKSGRHVSPSVATMPEAKGGRSARAQLLVAAAGTATVIAFFRYLGDGIVFGRPDWPSFSLATAVIWTCFFVAMWLTRKRTNPR